MTIPKSKKRKIKSLVLIIVIHIFAFEFYRTLFGIQFNFFYLLIVIAILTLQVSFLVFIDYLIKKMGRAKKEFQINEYLTLKLETKTTNIYINDKLFTQCKFLLLNIPLDKIKEFDKIESIDEVAEMLDRKLEYQRPSNIRIHPETEFWAHCSNLQAWTEYNYNPRLLHSNLAFPLLKELTNVGDPIAKKVFKQEIQLRFESFNSPTQEYLIKNKYLKYFNKQEKEEIYNLILDEKIWINLGHSYLSTNKMKKALHSFLQARKINPVNIQTLFILLQIYNRLNDSENALKIVNEIYEYYPKNSKTITEKNSSSLTKKKTENFYFI